MSIIGADININGNTIAGRLGDDGRIHYDKEEIRELIAGESQKTTGKYNTTAYVTYRYDTSRKTKTDDVYELWKENGIMQNRINQLNALVFGTGIKWIYDDSTQAIIDRFWRINRLRRKLDAICTDAQLNGEVFIGLFPQKTGDVLVSIYTSKQVDIDFDPSNIYNINRYIVTYKNEETGKDEQFDMMPIENYLNNIEFSQGINTGIISKVRKALGMTGSVKVKGKGVMAHIKFNNSSGEVYGTSDFQQGMNILQDYDDFAGDRFTVHQLYGSPAFDITIDTDDPEKIEERINDLAGFGIGSNPVHNKSETWKPLEFNTGGIPTSSDDRMFRGLLCAALSFPEFMLFNQDENSGDDNAFAVTKLAQNRQAAFREAFIDIHKFVVAIAGGDISMVDDGQILFPEIDTMSEKTKAETYVLKVGANICSRRTAAMNMGHNWNIEESQIIEETKAFAQLSQDSDFAGMMGGRFTSRQNNSASQNSEDADNGDRDRRRRADATRADTTQVVNSDRKRD